MTVSSTTNTVQYTGNGSTKSFAYGSSGTPLIFFATTDLAVTLYDTTAKASVSPAPVLNGAGTYDYTVTATQDTASGEYNTGATVTFNNAPLSNHRITIARNVPATQGSALSDNTKFPAKTVEAALDRATIIGQQVAQVASLSLQAPSSDPLGTSLTLPPVELRKGNFLTFDPSTGAPTATAGAANAAVSAAMAPVVGAANLPLAQTAFGISSFMQGVLPAVDAATARSSLSVPADAVVLKTGKQTIFIPVGAMNAPAANAPASGNQSLGNVTLPTKDFDPATRQSLFFAFQAPKSWDLGSITFQAEWAHPNTSGNFGVTWGLRGLALTAGENIANQAMGTQVNVSDTGGNQNFSYRTPVSGNLTVGSSPSASDLLVFELAREPADAADTMAVNAKLVGISLLMNISAANDT